MRTKFGNWLWIPCLLLAMPVVGCNETDTSSPPTGVGGNNTGGHGGDGGAGGGGSGGTGGTMQSTPSGSTAVLGLLETTDLHSNIRSYDYFKLIEDKNIGMERTATLIKEARVEFPNHLLIDNGDTIQGTVLADFQSTVQPIPCNQTLAMYKVMNHLEYDAAGIGNHEFNFGLAFLSQVTHQPFDVPGLDLSGSAACMGPDFPQVNSNVFSVKTDENLFPSSTVVTKKIAATGPDGKQIESSLRVGFFDFTPPQILNWDKKWLDGKVYTKGVNEVAAGIVAELRNQGADLVVAIIHGGLDASPYTPTLENQAWHLAHVAGIDAMLMGHSHQIFPNPASTYPPFNLAEVDKNAGTVAGVPAVMANFWGQHLGVMKMELTHDGTSWTVDKTKTVVEARPIATTCTGALPVACNAMEQWRTGAPCSFANLCDGLPDKTKIHVPVDPEIAPLLTDEHEATIGYVTTPIGVSDFEMTTMFAEEGDPGAIQIVNQAQAAYVSDYVQANLPQYAGLPVLSVSAPFKFGNQGGTDYTDVMAGNVAINNAADLYLYPNTLQAVKVTGAELVDWLETAATRFAQIDPMKSTPQPLINTVMPGYNFDIITDTRVSYEIDLTQPLPAMGMKASGRIKNLMFDGAPINLTAEFIVATNNYRASGGGNFPGLDGSKTIWVAPDTNREVLIAYIKKIGSLTRQTNGSARSFHFTKVATAGQVTFLSAQNALPKATAAGLTNISLLQQDDGSGKALSIYAIDLNQ